MLFTEVGILRILVRIGQDNREDPAPISLEGRAVDGGEAPEEIPAASPRESLDFSLDTSTMDSSYSAPTFATLERDLG